MNLTADELHVLLDAAGMMCNLIGVGEAHPWDEYDGEDDDPKTTEDGYVDVLGSLIGKAQSELIRS